MAKRSRGWVKCEDRLPYYKDSSCSLPLATIPRPRLHDPRGPRRGRPGSRARSSGALGAVAKARHEIAARESAEAMAERRRILELDVRKYHTTDKRSAGSGKPPLDQLLANGVVAQRKYVRRQRNAEEGRAKEMERKDRVVSLRASSAAGRARAAAIATGQTCSWHREQFMEDESASSRLRRNVGGLGRHRGLQLAGVVPRGSCCLLLPCCTSFLPWFILPSLLRRCSVGCSCSCIGGPSGSKSKGGCGSVLRASGAHLSRD
jgi:hypothetical protein